MAGEAYKGDLEGAPVQHSASMRCGVCLCGDLIGVDLVDQYGETIAHGHLDGAAAVDFMEMYGDAIEEVLAKRDASPKRDEHG